MAQVPLNFLTVHICLNTAQSVTSLRFEVFWPYLCLTECFRGIGLPTLFAVLFFIDFSSVWFWVKKTVPCQYGHFLRMCGILPGNL